MTEATEQTGWWKERILTTRRELALLLFGFVLAGGVAGGFFVYRAAQPLADQQAEAIARLSAKVQEYNSAVTLLAEPAEVTASLPAAIQQLLPEPWRSLANGPGGQPRVMLRWWIPGKVMPLVYGDARGVKVFYFNLQTRKLDGPYLPRTVAVASTAAQPPMFPPPPPGNEP